MDIVLRTGFQFIKNTVDFAPATIEKGMKLAKEHVCRVQEKKTDFGAIIDGFVVRQTSVTATPYNVRIMVSKVLLMHENEKPKYS
jgi:hypothetical protein